MDDPRNIKINSYYYDLPEERIAKFPLEERDSSKLLIYKYGHITEDVFRNIAKHLSDKSFMIINETRVIQARLIFRKETGAKIEIFCLEPLQPFTDIQRAYQVKENAVWKCFVGNSKRWKSGDLHYKGRAGDQEFELTAKRIKRTGQTSEILFSWKPNDLTFSEILESTGLVPLPPYLKRKPVDSDKQRYQTIYARNDGSVAAPTAGFHFTDKVMKGLANRGIETGKITLHVGAGTFKPVISESIIGHEMHYEKVFIKRSFIEQLINNLDENIIAVGTTTVRSLESLYWLAAQIFQNDKEIDELNISQWEPYQNRDPQLSRREAVSVVLDWMKKTKRQEITGSTQLMIAPGYQYKMIDIMVTNFHQPKSTLLLLVAAFIGDDWKKAYNYALENDFRFLSYGDSCLFFNPDNTAIQVRGCINVFS